ncbi:MAG: STAS domain-containing protein [Bacteroidaceae bacterium]|nr:STAS domain-containing protein [Bacteroidaceae bacterium]
MDITINEQEGRLVVSFSGDFDNMASSQAERGLAPIFERTDCDVVLDCTDMSYISSSGLRILLNVFKHARANGHAVILKGMEDEVEEVFRLSGFLQLFKVEDV